MVEHGRNIFFAKQNFFFQKWFTTLLLSRGFLNSSQLFFSVRGSKVVPFGLEKNKHKRLFWFRCFSDKQAKLSLGKMLFGCCWLKKHKHLMNKWPRDQNNISLFSSFYGSGLVSWVTYCIAFVSPPPVVQTVTHGCNSTRQD
jgi:hypothetical protein